MPMSTETVELGPYSPFGMCATMSVADAHLNDLVLCAWPTIFFSYDILGCQSHERPALFFVELMLQVEDMYRLRTV